MKTLKNILIFALIAISYYGCFNDVSTEDNLLDQMSYNVTTLEEGIKNLPTEIYYTFKKDYRRCMTPRCGGYWIKAVNIPETVCPDGTIGGENGCYVAGFDLNGIELTSNDIVLGEFRKQQYGRIFADHLNLDSAFTPVLSESVPYDQISLIQDNGIRCITTPCYSQQIATVNTKDSWTKNKFKYAVKGRKNKKLLEKTFLDAYNNGGALVQGQWKFSRREKKRKKLKVTNVYVRKQAQIQESFCTFMKEANSNTFIAWNVKTYEQGKNLLSGANFESGTEDIAEGTCEDYRASCPRIYRPICGTIFETGETRTYGNLCGFKVAIRRVAGKDAKSKGSWTKGLCKGEVGDTCGGFRGRTCKQGLFCKYEIKDMCGASDMTGTCSEYAEICPMVFDPVCGCDGRNYSNQCSAWQHGISASYKGQCRE